MSHPDPTHVLDLAQRLGLALTIGFLVGVERGWKQRDEHDGARVAGIRTFALAGLSGGISGILAPLSPLLSAALALAFSGGFIIFQLRRADEEGDNSATSAIAGLVVFGLGAYAILGNAQLAAGAGVTAAVILAFKQALHAWVGSLTWSEIRSALLILIATLIVLPFLPAGPVDPWGIFDLRYLWLLTIAIAVASFGGYIALRLLGEKAGLAASALIGGLVSSTAVTLDLARRVQSGEASPGVTAANGLLATITSVLRIAVLAALLSWDVLVHLWAPLGTAVVVLLAGAWVLFRSESSGRPQSTKAITVRSPMDLVSVGRFAAILCLLTIAANLTSQTFGHAGLNAFAATAGLVDADAVVVSVGGLLQHGLQPAHAAEALALGLASNQVFKTAAALFAGSTAFAWRFGLVLLLAIVAALAIFALMPAA